MEYIEIHFSEDFDRSSKGAKHAHDMFQSMNPMFCLTKRIWKPQMDIFETREEIIIQAEIAGVEKEDISIEVTNKAVKISGNRCRTPPNAPATYRLAEIQFGPFERILYLPSLINTDHVTASFNNGFLELTMAKIPVQKPQKIELS
ncbi:Small heat shock protein (Hsp20 family protein) [Desulfamplus magnetovallimortis]|uniref:Small heat shock protein (Hsp20 family protein) n=1 Tax=Desulfamplus magnetovallimortis TaxID=1246637 RepID=A0A1W1HJQ0_9BACT|nr:Hsp20/alpha crystallin family protein [Desulfamplus magnetovallimortis]MBF0235464.1 Hsp20/alpha crystallin family protein [Desulfamplus sp.]SLM32635.1 Small heat shock protein (Hsp20 family protein) [Desulfamplus magnetovallimortis]